MRLSLLPILTCVLCAACKGSVVRDMESSLSVDTTLLCEGDLLLRSGEGLESRAVKALSDYAYSHIGMAHHDSVSGWMVVHAVPGESEDGLDRLKYEPVESFFCLSRANGGAIARVDCEAWQCDVAVGYALEKYAQGIPFDHDYSLDDSTRMYCSELVWRAYRSAGVKLIDKAVHTNPLHPSDGGNVIFPSDLIEPEMVTIISEF